MRVVPNTAVLFVDQDGTLKQSEPFANSSSQFDLSKTGAMLTFATPKKFAAGQVISPGAWEFQFWTGGSPNSHATLKLEFGYCSSSCTVKTPIINSNAGWNPTIAGGLAGVVTSKGAFTTTSPTILPPGGPYQLYLSMTVQNPGALSLLYGSAITPTNIATPVVLPDP